MSIGTTPQWPTAIAPDGRWIAGFDLVPGALDRSGIVFLPLTRPPGPDPARDGKFKGNFSDASNVLTAVPVDTTGPTLSHGSPAKVFDTRYAEPNPSRHFDVSADGQRFLMLKALSASDHPATPASMTVVEQWFEELRQRVPATGK